MFLSTDLHQMMHGCLHGGMQFRQLLSCLLVRFYFQWYTPFFISVVKEEHSQNKITFSIEKLFFQLLSATITALWSMGRCRSPRWAAGLWSRMYLWAQLYWSVLSLQLRVMQLLLVIHKVNYCKSWVTISAPISLINLCYTAHNALKEPEHDYMFSCCVSYPRWYIWELLQEW